MPAKTTSSDGSLRTMTGYDTEDRYYATRYAHGARTVYSIDLSLAAAAANLPRPDPTKPTEGNRQVNESHARGFGEYVRKNARWVAPALLLRAPDIFKFEVEKEIGGTEFGILTLPRLARTDLRILDGQHRILGLQYAVQDIADELAEKRSLLTAAREQGNAEVERQLRTEVRRLEDQRERLNRERISVQIYVEDQEAAYKQMFVDIADNALGITSTIRARFDHRKVVNRALGSVIRHPLLESRVDMQRDRVGGPSPNLMGAKHVADIIRAVTVGISGRVSRRQEDELKDDALVEKANNFLDALTAGFSSLDDVTEGSLTPEQLRKSSLLGSTTMMRILAGVYHELVESMSDEDVVDFFNKLAPFIAAPVKEGSPWLATGVFAPGAYAPMARRQNLDSLTRTIVGWARKEPDWMGVS